MTEEESRDDSYIVTKFEFGLEVIVLVHRHANLGHAGIIQDYHFELEIGKKKKFKCGSD